MTEGRERLLAIAGRWRTDGYVIGEPRVPIRGTDTYEVFPGSHFLVHHVDVVVGTQPVEAIEIIGEPVPAGDGFLARSFDSDGNVATGETLASRDRTMRVPPIPRDS